MALQSAFQGFRISLFSEIVEYGEPMDDLDSTNCRVMDPYKAITGGPFDS